MVTTYYRTVRLVHKLLLVLTLNRRVISSMLSVVWAGLPGVGMGPTWGCLFTFFRHT